MIVGCWPPSSWTSAYKRAMYHAYTAFIIVVLYTFTVAQLLDIILNVDNPDDFSENLYIMLGMVISCCKMTGLRINQKNIKILTNILEEKPFVPLEADEIQIRHKFEQTIQ